MRILIIEDERRLANVIKRGLVEEGYAVDLAYDGKEGKYMAELNAKEYDAMVLDINMPYIDGLTLCKMLRNEGIKTPILMLTAYAGLDDKVKGFDAGTDDYLTKPFSFLELRLRIQALIRRSKQEVNPIMRLDNLELDSSRHEVRRAGRQIKLTPKEFAILEFLLRHKDSVVTRTMLIEHVWDYNFDSMSNVVDVFVSSLRRKIDKNSEIKLVHTLHGVGYKASSVKKT